MKLINTLLTILFISLLSSPSWSVTIGDLVKRDDLYYEKFTDVPYTGKVTGEEQGSFKNGVKDAAWIGYWSNGQLYYKGNYKHGVPEGAWVYYYENGQLDFKVGMKDGMSEGTRVSYYENGQLKSKGGYKNHLREGAWFEYNSDGTVNKPWTGTFKDGWKISD